MLLCDSMQDTLAKQIKTGPAIHLIKGQHPLVEVSIQRRLTVHN
jgi:hypothetical protein